MGEKCRDIQSVFRKEGLIKCSILPPKKLLHSVLPYRCNNKLLFCLCKTCAIQQNSNSDCTHETVLRERWVMDEERLAVQKGYEVIQIFEVYEYKVTQYNRETGDGVLFVQYINTFLKLKAEASGHLSWVRTPEDEDRYIQYFFDNEGIRAAMQLKPSKRALAKLCVNSFGGKLSERNNRAKSKVVIDLHELYNFLATRCVEVTHLLFATDDVVWVTWRISEEEKIPGLPHTNEVIGAYVTAAVRLKLYSYLDSSGEKALYCDTDSAIYVQKETEAPLVECGDRSEDMTNELRPGEYIEKIVSAGSKNYAYRVGGGKTVCEVRSITLNCTAS